MTSASLPMNQFSLTTDRQHLLFSLETCREAYLVLTNQPGVTEDNAYHVVIGAQDNSVTEIRKQSPQTETKSFSTPDILSCTEMRQFWLKWEAGTIELGTGEVVGSSSLFSWRDLSPYDVNAISPASKYEDKNAHWEIFEDSS